MSVDSTAISRYINADGERRAVQWERARRGRAGSIPRISMPPNHRFSTYRLSPASAPSDHPLIPSDLTGIPRLDATSYRSLYNSGLHRTVFAQALMVEPALRFCSPHATICAFAYLCAPITENVPPEEPPTIPPGYHRFRSCAHRVPGYNGNWPVAANKRIGKAHKATRDICNDVKLRKVSWWLTTEAVLRRFR